MAVASMHLGVWSWSRQSPELQTECHDLSSFECGMVVGARVFHNLLSYWAFHTQTFLGFMQNGVKRDKHPVCGSHVGENALFMLEVRGE